MHQISIGIAIEVDAEVSRLVDEGRPTAETAMHTDLSIGEALKKLRDVQISEDRKIRSPARPTNAQENQLSTTSLFEHDGTAKRFRTAFVAFHLIAILVFAIPIDIFPAHLLAFLSPYMRCVGLNEMWDTFAPDPKSAEQYLKAIVIARSGSTEIYSFPRMEELSFSERYREERYRKFAESVLCKDCSGLWPDIDKEVARRVMNSDDLPGRVILVKFDSPINPDTGAVGDEAHAKPTVLSEQTVGAEDIE